jgi:hypothetical protein
MANVINNPQLGPYDSPALGAVDLYIPQGFWNRLNKDYPLKPTASRPNFGQLWPRGIHQAMVGAEILPANIYAYGGSAAFGAAPDTVDITITEVDISRSFCFMSLESPAGWTWNIDFFNSTTVRITLNEGGGSSASYQFKVVELPYGI